MVSSYNNTTAKKSQSSRALRAARRGFTIVEVVIVIAVIAILATIVVASYSAVNRNATENAIKSDLRTASSKLVALKLKEGTFPADTSSLNLPDDTEVDYSPRGETFCLALESLRYEGVSFHITEDDKIVDGPCPEGTTMQTFTASQCSKLPVYTGSNESAIVTLTDTRGGITQTYQVAKLVDNNCWMLNNLKLGSTTGTITLTPADTNIASNFTLPQLYSYSGTSSSYRSTDTPYAYGPVPGDTGSGATNYGYLYNWPAATAGETRATMPAGSGNAPHSICPVGWRLPGGGSANGTGNEFSILNAKMAGFSNNQDSTYLDNYRNYYSNWKNTGPFKGAFSGVWWEGFPGQGSLGSLWSRSAYPGDSNRAFSAGFYADVVDPDGYYGRDGGSGVRCLLN